MKTCPQCKESKPRTHEFFYIRPSGWVSWCRDCSAKKNAGSYQRHREKRQKWAVNYYRKNSDVIKARAKRWYERNPKRACDVTRRSKIVNRKKYLTYHHEYYLKHKEALLAKNKKYREEHREQVLSQKRQYRVENILHVRAGQKAYYERTKPEFYRKCQTWRRKNPDKTAEYQRRYRASHRDVARSQVRNRRARVRYASGQHSALDVQRLIWFQRGLCAYCYRAMDGRHTVDHRIPLIRGGSNDPANLCLACLSCNSKKSGLTETEYLMKIEAA